MKKFSLLLVLVLALTLCVTIPAMAETDFTFDRSVLELFEGEQLQLTLLRQGDALADEPVSYTSTSPKVLSVDQDGVVTANSKGKATINATMKVGKRTFKGSITLTVLRAVTSIEVNESNLTVVHPGDPLVDPLLLPMEDSEAADYDILLLTIGTERALKLNPLPKDASERRVDITVSEPSMVRVSSGTLTPKETGECLLTISSRSNPEVVRNYRVLVLQPVKSIDVSAPTRKIAVDGSVALTAYPQPSTASIKDVVWSSDDERIATVDQDGVVTGRKKGSVTIRATAADGSKKVGTLGIQVVQQPTDIELSSSEVLVAVGASKTVKATVLPSSVNDKTVVWTSSNESIAKVNSAGRITPVSAGECYITCASKDFPDVTAIAHVTVTQPITRITFYEKEVEVNVGEDVQVYWTTAPADATDNAVSLSSNNTKIATVDQSGVIHGVKRGSATITAKAEDGSGKKATIKVNVLQPVTGVHMKNATVTIDVEEPTTLTAVLEPSDASNTRMTWTSDDTRVMTVKGSKNKPTVTGHAWGDAILTGVTEDGGYTTYASVHVGNYDKALSISDLYLSNNAVKIAVRNVSNLNIARFYFRVTLFDLYGQPLPCNTVGTNVFDGSYAAGILYENESTQHGRFTFNSFVQPGEAIGKVLLYITGYATDDGYSRNIADNKQPFMEYTSPGYIGPLPETPEETAVPEPIAPQA